MKVFRAVYLLILMVLFILSGVTCTHSPAEESYDKGLEYATQGKFEEAKEEFEKALKVDEFNRSAEASLKTIKDIIAQNIKRETAIYLFNGTSFANKGQYDQAIKDYTKAIEINPSGANAYNNRGLIYLVILEDKAIGCADWKQACELGVCKNYDIAKRRGDCR